MDLNDSDHVGVLLARRAYIRGNIGLATFERALEDRLVGDSYHHDARMDGHIPPPCRGDDYTPEAY